MDIDISRAANTAKDMISFILHTFSLNVLLTCLEATLIFCSLKLYYIAEQNKSDCPFENLDFFW